MNSQKGSALAELVITLILCVVILIVGGIWHFGKSYVQCSNYSSITERDTKYSLISGCFVKSDSGRWIPQSEMTRTTIVENK
jgi:nitrogenase subunit NifH